MSAAFLAASSYAPYAIVGALGTGLCAYHFPNFARGVFTIACLVVIVIALNVAAYVA